jgi:hypothetical protein
LFLQFSAEVVWVAQVMTASWFGGWSFRVLMMRSWLTSKMMLEGSNRRIHSVHRPALRLGNAFTSDSKLTVVLMQNHAIDE